MLKEMAEQKATKTKYDPPKAVLSSYKIPYAVTKTKKHYIIAEDNILLTAVNMVSITT